MPGPFAELRKALRQYKRFKHEQTNVMRATYRKGNQADQSVWLNELRREYIDKVYDLVYIVGYGHPIVAGAGLRRLLERYSEEILEYRRAGFRFPERNRDTPRGGSEEIKAMPAKPTLSQIFTAPSFEQAICNNVANTKIRPIRPRPRMKIANNKNNFK